MTQLNGKVAIVTGSAGGIGAATARRLARAGASVVVADIDLTRAEAVAGAIVAEGGSASALQVDVSDEAQIAAMVEHAVDYFGRLDILHNNAAVTGTPLRGDGGVESLDADLWDRIMAVNTRGAALGCKHAVPALRRAGGGSIVNTASAAGRLGAYGLTAYGASKAAMITLTRYVATQHGREGIRCNTIVPGLVMGSEPKTYLTEAHKAVLMKSMLTPFCGTPEDVAELALFLASDNSRYITGQAIWIDGGASARSQNAVAQEIAGL
jgi:NAD(P)-dependent dehydrogenase (short-subunit alcohol dehydrogenase family)